MLYSIFYDVLKLVTGQVPGEDRVGMQAQGRES